MIEGRMSNPPPIPTQIPPTSPPLPVTPLNYDNRMYVSRPSLITAMGVISIIIGCMSGLGSFSGIFSTLAFSAMSRTTIPTGATPSVTVTSGTGSVSVSAVVPGAPGAPGAPPAGNTGNPANSANSPGSVTVGGVEATAEDSQDAMAEPQRRIVLDTLSRMSSISDQRQQQLELLLSVEGQKVFPFGDRITPQLIRSNVTERG